MDALHEDRYTCLITSCSTLLGMRCFRQKLQRRSKHTFLVNNFFFLNEMCRYEIMWKNIVELGRPEMTIRHMPNACWISKVANTHSEYVILIALPLQQWLHKHSSMLHYVCIALSFTAYITRCIYNLNNNMIPIINDQTLGIGAEWCQLMKQ